MELNVYEILGIIAFVGLVVLGYVALTHVIAHALVEDIADDDEYYPAKDEEGGTEWYRLPTANELQEVFDLLRNLKGKEVIVSWLGLDESRGTVTATIIEVSILKDDYVTMLFEDEDLGGLELGSISLPKFCKCEPVELYVDKEEKEYTYTLKPTPYEEEH